MGAARHARVSSGAGTAFRGLIALVGVGLPIVTGSIDPVLRSRTP